MEIRRIVPDISSDQIDESKRFYQDFLGMNLEMDMEWILTFVSTSNPTAQITILKTEGPVRSNSNIMISMEVEDVDLAYDKAVDYGYEITYPLTVESWGVKRFFVKDPNGVIINLMCHQREN